MEGCEQEMMRLRHRVDEDELRWKTREQELLERLEDGLGLERKLEDQKHNLEVCLSDQTIQIQEMKCKLSAAEGRLRSADTQLADLERTKRDVESRLNTIWSTLKRVTGMQSDGSVRIRKWSPNRSNNILLKHFFEFSILLFIPKMFLVGSISSSYKNVYI